jgi:hypothetical protein
MTKTYQEICHNLSAIELFPKQRIREVGDRIRIPVKPDTSVWAFLWHNAGLNTKQIRKLVGKICGNFISYKQTEYLIANGKHRLSSRESLAALRLTTTISLSKRLSPTRPDRSAGCATSCCPVQTTCT